MPTTHGDEINDTVSMRLHFELQDNAEPALKALKDVEELLMNECSDDGLLITSVEEEHKSIIRNGDGALLIALRVRAECSECRRDSSLLRDKLMGCLVSIREGESTMLRGTNGLGADILLGEIKLHLAIPYPDQRSRHQRELQGQGVVPAVEYECDWQEAREFEATLDMEVEGSVLDLTRLETHVMETYNNLVFLRISLNFLKSLVKHRKT